VHENTHARTHVPNDGEGKGDVRIWDERVMMMMMMMRASLFVCVGSLSEGKTAVLR
jgi:hypothetical protein